MSTRNYYSLKNSIARSIVFVSMFVAMTLACAVLVGAAVPGDVNGDGKVDIRDAASVLLYVNDMPVECQDQTIDTNGDGSIDNLDVSNILNYLTQQNDAELIVGVTCAHELTYVAPVAATCVKEGNIEHWTCSICSKVFKDENGITLLTEAATIIPQIGDRHTMSNGTCTVCGYTEVSTPSEGLKFTLNSDGKSYSVTGIGTCTDMDVVIPSVYNGLPVTSIGDMAFKNCSSRTSFIIPGSVETIGEHAFSYCTGLKQVIIANGVINIGGGAFYECENLTNISIPDTVVSIGPSAFNQCYKLTSIVIPKGVIGISPYTFYACYNLTNITLPDSITSIGKNAFDACISLTNITLPQNIATIADGAFQGSGLTSITLPESIASIGSNPWDRCSSLTEIIVNSNNSFYHSIGNCIIEIATKKLISGCQTSIIPTDGSVLIIGKSSFGSCYDLKNITIPDGVVSIENSAFEGCYQLANITIPNSVTHVEGSAFKSCDSLNDVYYTGTESGWNLVTIDSYYNEDILTATIHFNGGPDDIPHIRSCGEWIVTREPSCTQNGLKSRTICSCGSKETASIQSTGHKRVVVPRVEPTCTTPGLTEGKKCSICGTFTTVQKEIPVLDHNISGGTCTICGYPESTTASEGLAFTLNEDGRSYSVTGIGTCTDTDIVIPTIYNGMTVTTIGKRAFYNCNDIISVVIPNSVTSIEGYAFDNCDNLTKIAIPDSVRSIGKGAFEFCEKIKSITIPNGVTSIEDYTFQGCVNLGSVSIPDSVTSIGKWAFSQCMKLGTITIPSKVTIIEDGAFYYCENVWRVNIPASVTSIGKEVFNKCDNIISLTVDSGNSVYYSNGNCIIERATNALVVVVPVSEIPTDGSITGIGGYAFYSSDYIEITIPDSVIFIDEYAFASSYNLKKIAIPDSVTSIGKNAFVYCMYLDDVYFSGTEAEWNAIAIDSGNDYLLNATIHYNS